MRFKRPFFCTSLFVFFGLLGLQGQSLSVDAVLSTNEILIGDEVKMTISISADPSVRINAIGLGELDKLDKIEVKNIAPADTASREPVFNIAQEITLTSFDSGVYKLPPIPVTYEVNGQGQISSTPELQLIVSTIPVELSDSTDIQPIKEILKEPIGIEEVYPYLLIGAGVGLLVFLVMYYIRRKNRPVESTEPEAPPLKAHELALQKLASLKASDLLTQNAFKAYQSELTYILREYLENRYHIAALESTTGEILQDLLKVDFPEEWHQRLKAMLQKVDLIKFAKADYPMSFHEESVESVESFIVETQEQEVQEEEKASEVSDSENQEN